ncbi:CD225/dispanin family protein [Halpernia sp. GG3]
MENYSSPISNNQNGIPPKTWLVESILVTIFCCQILGVISIIYAAGVESKFYRGDIAGAESASRTAKTLVMVSVGVGLLTVVLFMAFGGMAILGGVMNR